MFKSYMYGSISRPLLGCLYFSTKSLSLSTTQRLSSLSVGATRSIVLIPPGNYIVFQNDTPAIFYCYGNGLGTGAVVSWSLNGAGYGTQHAQMGITYVIDPPTEDTVSSRFIVPSNSTINNNTQVVCRAADITFTNVLKSQQTNLTIQGECCTTPCKYAFE